MPSFIERGDAVPAVTLPDLEGQPVSLDAYRDGRKLLLFMWASW
jgi:peroxiredoxin